MEVEKKWVIFGIVVLLILAGYVAANKYFFYEKYNVKIQEPSLYIPPQDIPEVVIIKPFEGTLKKIITPNNMENEGALQEASTTGKGRNPFLWMGELQPKKVVAPVVIAKQLRPVEIPKMGMIIVGENRNTVMLDRTLVSIGESYGGHVIDDIKPQYIVLSGEYGKLRISISEKSFAAPKVDILEGNNPNLLIDPFLSGKKKR